MPEKDGRRAAVPAVEKGVEEGWCELLDADGDVLPGIRVEVRSGHSAGHQIVWIGEGDDPRSTQGISRLPRSGSTPTS